MTSEKKNDRQVIFRRIGGRIVPISVGVGAIAASQKINLEKIRKQSSRYGSELGKVRPIKWATFQRNIHKIYGESISKAGVVNTSADLGHMSIFSSGDFFGFGVLSSGKEVPIIGSRTKSLPAFAHELGHALQAKSGSRLNLIATKARKKWELLPSSSKEANSAIKFVDKLESKIPFLKRYTFGFGSLPFGTRKIAIKARQLAGTIRANTLHLPVIANEADAWIRAYKISPPKIRRTIPRQAFKALHTYSAIPLANFAKIGLAAGGAGLIGYGLLKKGDNKK